MSDDFTGFEYAFDAKYHVRTKNSSSGVYDHKYRIVIGSSIGGLNVDELTFNRELDIMSPGPTLTYQGSEDRFMKAVMGSTLSMTFRLNDPVQITAFERMLNEPNETIFCLFFTDWAPNSRPQWYGHLVGDDMAMEIRDGYRYVDITFTDGLSQLRSYAWTQSDGTAYTGFHSLRYYMYEIIKKLPAFPAYFDWCWNQSGISSNLSVLQEIGLPNPVHNTGGNAYSFDDIDSKLYYIKVRAETFTKPKKEVDRVWELPYKPEFFNAGDVLEDIAKTFGATVALFGGAVTLICRLDVATLGGEDIRSIKHRVDSTGVFASTTVGTPDLLIEDFDDEFRIRAGAVMKRTRAVSECRLTHEEGGSDWLYANGFFLDPSINYIDHSDQYFSVQAMSPESSWNSGASTTDMSLAGNRRDLIYTIWGGPNAAQVTPGVIPYPATQQIGTGYFFPKKLDEYVGFPPSTTSDLEVQSGEPLTLQLSTSVKWIPRNGVHDKQCVGATLIVRMRIEFTTTSGVKYRLRRVVNTHVLSGSSYDGINIEMSGLIPDRKYYRKYYQGIEWVKTGDSNFNDGWFETMMPHGDTNSTGEGFGADVIDLAINYADQINYAPVGVKIQGEVGNNGATIFEEGDSEHFHHFMSLDRAFELPYGDNDEVLDFESFYFEMGYEQYEAQRGPRSTAPVNSGAEWYGNNPLFRSANADGSGGLFYPGFSTPNVNYIMSVPHRIWAEGVRVIVGDGSESSDFVTKISGGDGYEVVNIGSSRLGSRIAFQNAHTGGTLFARKRTGNNQGDFEFPDTYENHTEQLQWRGALAGETLSSGNDNYIPTNYYDSLHGYVCYAYLDMFGESRKVYDMSLMNIGEDGWEQYLNPFRLIKTQQTVSDKTITEYLMPIDWRWTADVGVEGSFIVTKFERERPDIDWWGGDPDGGDTDGIGGGNGTGFGKGDLYGPVGAPGGGVVSGSDVVGNGLVAGLINTVSTNTKYRLPHVLPTTNDPWDIYAVGVNFLNVADSKISTFVYDDIYEAVRRVTFDPTPTNNSIVVVEADGSLSFIGIGSSGQYLQSNGNGTYTWVTPSAASGGGFYTVKGYRFWKGTAGGAGWMNLVGEANIASIQDARANFVAPEDCMATEYSFYSQGASSATFRIYINGSIAQSLNITLTAGTNTGSFTGQGVSISSGDRVSFNLAPLAGISGVFMNVKLEV